MYRPFSMEIPGIQDEQNSNGEEVNQGVDRLSLEH